MLPDNFKVTEDHRSYCLDRGWPPKIADVFLPRFVTWWKDLLADGRKPKWRNPDLAFKNWIRNSSPLTVHKSFYNPAQWEKDLEQAKRLDGVGPRIRPPIPYDPRGFAQPERTPSLAREYLQRAMAGLKT